MGHEVYARVTLKERVAITHALQEQLQRFCQASYSQELYSAICLPYQSGPVTVSLIEQVTALRLYPHERDIIVLVLQNEYKKIEQAGGDRYSQLPLEWLPNLIAYLQNPQDYPESFVPCPTCGKRIHPILQMCAKCEIDSRRNDQWRKNN